MLEKHLASTVSIRRSSTFVVPALVAGILLAIVGSYIGARNDAYRQEQHAALDKDIGNRAELLRRQLDRSLSAPALLATMLQQYGEIRDFDAVAAGIIRNFGAIGTLQLAPEGIVSHAYPLAGNESAIGHNLLADPARRDDAQAAIKSRKLTVSAPVNLIQGGKAIIARLPVFRRNASGREQFWGFTIALIRIPDLVESAQLRGLTQEGYNFTLVYQRKGSTDFSLIANGGAKELTSPSSRMIELPGGDTVTLRAEPRDGWATLPTLYVEGALLVLASLLLVALSHHLLRRPELLRREVEKRTRELTEAKERLEHEITERITAEDALRRSQEFLDSVVENIPNMIFVKDAQQLRFVRFNRAAEALLGYSRTEMLGKNDHDFFPEIQADFFNAKDREVLNSGKLSDIQVEEIDTRCNGKRLLHTKKIPIFDKHGTPRYLLGISEDVTEHMRAQRKIVQLSRTYAVLSGVNEAIARTKERQVLLDQICHILVEAGEFHFACVYLEDDERNMFEVAASAGDDRGLITGLRRLPAKSRGEDRRAVPLNPFHGKVCREGSFGSEPWCCHAIDCGHRSCAGFPLNVENRNIGGLTLFSSDSERFDDAELKLLERLAGDLSHALQTLAQDGRRRRAEEQLRLAARVFENSTEGILITDAKNNILLVNREFAKVTGYMPEEVIGKNPRLLNSGEQDAAFYQAMWASIRDNGEWHGEVKNRRKNGEVYPEWLTISAVKNDTGETTNYVAVFIDLTTRKQVEERLNFLAYYDTLTSLPNRLLFTDRLEQVLIKAHRTKTGAAVMFLDLNRFNTVNETYGHSAGDELLKEVSRRLVSAVRYSDSVARLGGDEFTVIIPDLDEPHDAAVVAQKILDALSRPVYLGNDEVFTSASIGISVFPEDGENVETLIKNADTAMYFAMKLGNAGYSFYTQDMNARSSERMSLESKLRHAIDRGELQLHYQPLVNAQSGRIVGAEALLRWYHVDDFFISPAAFIPLLEETGLIVPVGEWVLRTACMQHCAWRDAGFPEVSVAVNFSAQQFHQTNVIELIERTLSDTGADPNLIEIELTESTVMRNAEDAVRTLQQLKAMGIKLAIDDFGTGYSSFTYLKRFPLDKLKIDRSFICDAPIDLDAAAIVAAIIGMGHSMRFAVLAEGVETAEQVAFLRANRCDILQGYYFSRPVPQAEFIALLRQHAGSMTLPALQRLPAATPTSA